MTPTTSTLPTEAAPRFPTPCSPTTRNDQASAQRSVRDGAPHGAASPSSARASGLNLVGTDSTSTMQHSTQYVRNPMSGMYRSGALMSLIGGLNFMPPATWGRGVRQHARAADAARDRRACSSVRFQWPRSVNGKSRTFSLLRT